MKTIKHALPGESGDISWFQRQNEFEQKVILQQVTYKNALWPELGDGRDPNNFSHTYPHNIERDTIKLHYLYFDEQNNKITIQPGDTTLAVME